MKILNEELNDDIVKEIGKFTILWAEFEKQYCKFNCAPHTIANFAENYVVDNQILEDFSIKIRERAEFFNLNIQDYIKDSLIPENAVRPPEQCIKEMQKFVQQKSNRDLLGAFLCIYRIRNNLLHGLKVLSELNGQIELFKSMNKVLENIRSK